MMKSRYLAILFLGLLTFISSQTDSNIFYTSQIIHSKAELGKVCHNQDGTNTIISRSTQNSGIAYISKLINGKKFDYKQSQFNLGYDSDAQIMQTKNINGENAYTVYHKLNGKEYFTEFKEKGEDISSKDYTSFHAQASTFPLKNGAIFFAGINKPTGQYAKTTIDIKTFNSQTRTELTNGISLNAYSHLISCAEIRDNEVYCAFVHEESLTKRAALKLQYFRVTENGLISQDTQPYLIKSFYTDFNMIKLIKINDNEVGIIFQTGNGQEKEEIPYGNTGKDLYFYHLKVSSNSMEVLTYDYIYNNCRLRTDSEDYTVDVIAVQNTVYAICEVDNDPEAFQIMKIYRTNKKFEEGKIYNLGGKIKNPQFVLMGNSIGVLYTRIDLNDVKDVMLLMVNYPDCEDSENKLIIYPECPYGVNQLVSAKMESYFKIYTSNPYLKNTNVPLYYRITNSNNIKIMNGNSQLELNKDYEISTLSSLYVQEYDSTQENTFIEYTVIKKENGDTIIGGTCKINVDIPKCWEGCRGCEPEGTKEDNRCFDCKDGYYPIPKGKDNSGLGCGKNDQVYNCNNCDIACTECFGPFDESYPTTNCNYSKCNFEKGYFPLESNTTICFNESDKEEWEEKLNLKCSLFLDKSKGAKENWVWACCDIHCSKCHMRPTEDNMNCDACKTNEGFFFYINQTSPDNCHPSCEGEGCYKCESGGMEKMCPCLPYCKTCKNKDTCEECFKTWFLHHEKTSCDKDCDYCYTKYFEKPETQENGKCINCATYFDPPQYTYEKKCYSSIPTFEYEAYNSNHTLKKVIRKYNIIDDTCNLLTACKEGCKTCSAQKTDKCTECEEDYYEEDRLNKTDGKPFHCFSKNVCRGSEPYPHPHDPELRVGGVPIEEDDKKVCLNCRLRNNSYRQPEPNYWCGPYKNRTYIDIPEYNKLSDCYVRCKTCSGWGHSCAMACTSCRDSKYYDLIRYNKYDGQCYRKQHKCGIYPYYHNYELATDEDDCGEDCDVCLYNFMCPKEFPYFKFETHECVEFCPFTDVLAGQCNVNSSAALLYLLKNPFGLRNPYERYDRAIYLHELLKSDLAKYLSSVYPEIDYETIFNYIGNGKVFNLPKSQIIIGNNISIELTSVRLELEKIAKYFNSQDPIEDPQEPVIIPENDSALPIMDMSTCQNILKKKYSIPEEEELVIVKITTPDSGIANISWSELIANQLDYKLFSMSLGAFLPLSDCTNEDDSITVYNPFKESLITTFQSKIGVVVSNGYDIFNANSPFYNDVCTPFTNENGQDVLLDARRQDYYDENINLCDKGCAFVGYSTSTKTYICKCNVKAEPGEDTGDFKGEIVERVMPENFKDLISRRSNIAVFKCASQVFSAKGQNKNYGSYMLLASIAAFIGVLVFHFVKEKGSMAKLYNNIAEARNLANPPKGEKKEDKKGKKENKEENKEEKKNKKNKKKDKVTSVEDNNYDRFVQRPANVNNAVLDLKYEDDYLNFAPYDDAVNHDTRSVLATYWSFLKFKQSIIFTFYTRSNGILRSTKIALFILFFAFYMAFTALFFNDDIMRALYIYRGDTNAAVHVPNIILSSLCSFIASIIVRFVCLGEGDISKVLSVREISERKKLAERAKKRAMIKLYCLYALSGVLILLCWYYVSAFCAVFKNSQKNYLINFVICFIVLNIWPFITSFIPTIMRRHAINESKKCLYSASKIVSVF